MPTPNNPAAGPQPWKGWAVFNRDGRCLLHTIDRTRAAATNELRRYFLPLTWQQLAKRGFSVRRVIVSEPQQKTDPT